MQLSPYSKCPTIFIHPVTAFLFIPSKTDRFFRNPYCTRSNVKTSHLFTRHSPGCVRNQHHQAPCFCCCSVFLPIFPSLSPSFCLGRHPGQIVPCRISLKECWWSALPSLSKCAQVHLSVHCLEMDYQSWNRKKNWGGQKRLGRGRSTYLSSRLSRKFIWNHQIAAVKWKCRVKKQGFNNSFSIPTSLSGTFVLVVTERFAPDSAAASRWQSTWKNMAHWWMHSSSDCKDMTGVSYPSNMYQCLHTHITVPGDHNRNP